MNYVDPFERIIPEVSDIGNADAYCYFSQVLVRKNVYVYYVRDTIEKYLKTDTQNPDIITDFVLYMCRFLDNEIRDFDNTCKLYPKFTLDKFRELLRDYTEYYYNIKV
jgi:hypothetical protein